jgi:hypothetical protein
MTLDILLALVSSIVIPLIACAVWLAGRLARLEGEIKSLVELKDFERETINTRITKLEQHVHDIRNSMQTMTIAILTEKYRGNADFKHDGTNPFGNEL